MSKGALGRWNISVAQLVLTGLGLGLTVRGVLQWWDGRPSLYGPGGAVVLLVVALLAVRSSRSDQLRGRKT